MKNFIKGFRFTPSNYPAAVEEKIQKYRKQGYKLPPRKVLRTPEQLEGIRESAKINTALLDYISENIREGMSTEEIDVMVYDFTTGHGAIPAPLNYEGFPKSVCTSINDVVCHGIPNKNEILKSGDIINVDVSTVYQGYYSDASRTFCIGEVSADKKRLGAKTLFATHYHELNDMEASFERIENYNVSVKESGNRVVFLRKLVKGGSAHSFGIHVAKLAGMPSTIVKRADSVLADLEKVRGNDSDAEAGNGPRVKPAKVEEKGVQMSFFQLDDPVLSQIRDEIIGIDINNLTPVAALNKLNQIRSILTGKNQ